MNTASVPYQFNPSITQPAYLTRNRLLRSVAELAPSLQGKVLDFGCGAKPYQSLFTQAAQYIGVDYQNEGHSHENEHIDFFYDGKTLPFANGEYDAIFSSEVFEHVFNLDGIMKELNRVLKPGGSLLLTCPFAICEHEVPNDFARYSSFAIRHILEKNGFTVTRQFKTANAVETVFQLWINYIHQYITPFVAKIPVVRSVFRVTTYGILNLTAIALGALLPRGESLYLNNVVLAQKNGAAI
ncbi:class I SAM-dependent methyltransferase [Filimonas effusa]|uniref:Class I SAM-dependent methyltransferase n=1 Tax=Filimonas effusa TaxID=2508721 RepID=A0A4Q1DCV8_9BACT|nr:class I SAM-dependent methyltransferase [Filimonas effusa]RXK86808.1 class I SAM-dependent methyltransferase [Filimonas effusa]